MQVFLLCLLAGCSICWFNTVCFVLCIRNFPLNRSLALSLSISFNGVSAALYTLVANAVSGGSSSSYLLLNAILPVLTSFAALPPILRQPPDDLLLLPPDAARRDSRLFLVLHILAFLTGLFLLFLNSISSNSTIACIILAGAVVLLVLPLATPGVLCAREWAHRTLYSVFHIDALDAPMNNIDADEFELNKELMGERNGNIVGEQRELSRWMRWRRWCKGILIEKDRLVVLGEEHSARMLISRIDFWLYYVAYFCGATVGLVYSNNLGQIAQSLSRESKLTMLVTVYSSCSFFGRLLSAAPDFLRGKVHFARTGWLAAALVPMPLAFFILAAMLDGHALMASTAIVGLSSGFIFAAAVSVTSELFGSDSVGVNHNILITNIPLGSLLYGQIAALVYDANGKTIGPVWAFLGDNMIVCMGKKCYAKTFFLWGCISLLGLISSIALFLRTRLAYDQAERRRRLRGSMGTEVRSGEDF
ncbi:protein NUCLEAR FUSION DEFECTIVE 4-like isoform X2 [Typha angustifolia]|uniref:protein NUCLEAR FUSION DEFECTIVE 4-like isoform X2 n=1 Tax=Typha angustifolia TaxID=59011 RepID=UPI003C2CA3CD